MAVKTTDPVMLPPLPNYTNVLIVARTLKQANEFFDQLNVFQRKWFTRWTAHEKRTQNNVRFFMALVANVTSVICGRSLQFVIVHDSVSDKEFEKIKECIYPVLASCKGIMMRIPSPKGE